MTESGSTAFQNFSSFLDHIAILGGGKYKRRLGGIESALNLFRPHNAGWRAVKKCHYPPTRVTLDYDAGTSGYSVVGPSPCADCSACMRSLFKERSKASSSSIEAIRAVAASSLAVVAARSKSRKGTFGPCGTMRSVESQQEETAQRLASRRTSRE